MTQQLPRARGGFSLFKLRDGRIAERLRNFLALDLGVAVQNYVAEVKQELGGAVASAREVEEFRRVVEERSGDLTGAETRMIDHVFDKGDVGLHAANAKFAKGAVHAMAGAVEGVIPGGDFYQERIVIGRQDSAGVSGAAVETNAKTGGRAIGG